MGYYPYKPMGYYLRYGPFGFIGLIMRMGLIGNTFNWLSTLYKSINILYAYAIRVISL